MTIDEAISILKQYIDYNNPDIPDFYTMEEACKVVIEALENQPTDAVDRVTIKEYLDSFGKETNVTTTSELSSIRHELSTSYNGVKTELEPCGDCISRQAVLEAIDVKAWEFCDYLIRNGRNDEQKPVSHFADNLRECVGEDLPSVTPQQKIGRWIMSDDGLYRPICNNCGAHPWKGYIPTVEEATEVFKYCPNCGSYNGCEG